MRKRRPRSKLKMPQSFLDKLDKEEVFSSDHIYRPVESKPTTLLDMVDNPDENHDVVPIDIPDFESLSRGTLQEWESPNGHDPTKTESKYKEGRRKSNFGVVLPALVLVTILAIGVIIILLMKGGV